MDHDSGVSLPTPGEDAKKRRVTYIYDPNFGNYVYSEDHYMRPHRVRMAHSLIQGYKLDHQMEICRPTPASGKDFRRFHDAEYVDFISTVSPSSVTKADLARFNVGERDCPAFDGLFELCQSYVGGSIGAAAKLNRGDADIAINWSGGLHHAKRSCASGFCYVNDIVLGIWELLKDHQRVLYVDIDIHHGDGVEEAFYTSDRVMTVSFHKFGDKFFPGSGNIKDIGIEYGKNYSVNVPLKDGIDDTTFSGLFRPIIAKVMEVYRPDVVVLQCGADSLSGDRLGSFNLTLKGHGDCLNYLRSFNIPLMVLGGGGYTIRNVARAWCYETSIALGIKIDNKLPNDKYYNYYRPDHELHIKPDNKMENLNSRKDIEYIRTMIMEQLCRIPHAPSVEFKITPNRAEVPVTVEKKRIIKLEF